MKRLVVSAGLSLLFALTGCGSTTTSDADEANGAAASEVVLDVRCAADADCPDGYECETEVEHGVDQSYCVSHDEDAAAAGECPAGYELEEEHGGTFCEPHGGDDADDDGGDADDDADDDDDDTDAGDDHGGGDDDAADAEDAPDDEDEG